MNSSGKYILKKSGIELGNFKNYEEIRKYLHLQNISMSIDNIRRISKGFYKRENLKNKSQKRDNMLCYEIINTQKI